MKHFVLSFHKDQKVTHSITILGGDAIMLPDNTDGKWTPRLRLFVLTNLFPLIVLFFMLAAIHPATVRCQTDLAPTQTPTPSSQSDSTVMRRGTNEFGVLGGIAFHAPTLWGTTEDARFGNIAFRYGRVLAANKTVAFQWTIDASPLAVLSLKRFTFTETSPGRFAVTTHREKVYGTGLSPIGLKFNFRPQRRLQPFGSATGGFLFFGEDIPIPGAARFNFNVEFSGGVQIISGSRRGFTLGYKYQHISNGKNSQINPGVDLQSIYAGFSIFR